MAMGEFAFIISSEAFKNGAVTEGFYTSVIGAALITMILLPILSKDMFKVSDWLSTKRPQPLGFIGTHAYGVRNDIFRKVESSPKMSYYIKSNLKKTYFCIVLIVVIEIVFSSLMESMTVFLAELINSNVLDDRFLAYIILMVVNFILLSIPTYALIRSIKSIDRLMVEGERRIVSIRPEEDAKRIKAFYENILNFSTMALIFVIDFIIMAMVPGPFGAEKSSLVVVPIAVVIFLIGYILAKRNGKDPLQDSDE